MPTGSTRATSARRERVREVVRAAKDHGCPMRIGVNAGSLERDLWRSTASPAPRRWSRAASIISGCCEDNDFHEFKISVKASDVFLAAAAYQALAEATDAPIHLGITEAGGFDQRHGEVGGRPRAPALDGDRRHDPGEPLGRSGRGGAGRVRDPEGARAEAPRGEHHLVPVLRAAGVRRDQDGRDPGEAAGAHQDADVAVDHRLRGERAGRGAS